AGIARQTRDTTDFFFFQAEDGIRDRNVDWSSDVCSSDLDADELRPDAERARRHRARGPAQRGLLRAAHAPAGRRRGRAVPARSQIGRASCRERGEGAGEGGALGEEEWSGLWE